LLLAAALSSSSAPARAETFTVIASLTLNPFSATGVDDTTIKAKVFHHDGAPAAGVNVSFSADEWNSIDSNATTDANGIATSHYGVVDPGTRSFTCVASTWWSSGTGSCTGSAILPAQGDQFSIPSPGPTTYYCRPGGFSDSIPVVWSWQSIRSSFSYFTDVIGDSGWQFAYNHDYPNASGQDGVSAPACNATSGSHYAYGTLGVGFYVSGGGQGWYNTRSNRSSTFQVVDGN
jgi:hypothetical protein